MCVSDSSRVIQQIPAVTKNLFKLLLGNWYLAMPKGEQHGPEWMWEENLKSLGPLPVRWAHSMWALSGLCRESPRTARAQQAQVEKGNFTPFNQSQMQQTKSCTLDPGSCEGTVEVNRAVPDRGEGRIWSWSLWTPGTAGAQKTALWESAIQRAF